MPQKAHIVDLARILSSAGVADSSVLEAGSDIGVYLFPTQITLGLLRMGKLPP